MQICLVSGSHRKNSQSEKVALYFQKIISQIPGVTTTEMISLGGNPLPFLDEDFFDRGNEKWQALWRPFAEILNKSDGLVVVSPEWHGSVPAGLKNFFLLASAEQLGHKPALAVSVSSGIGGVYPIVELKGYSAKNSRLCYIPEHVIVRKCTTVLESETPADENDKEIRKRIDYASKLLVEYAKALKSVRQSGQIDHKTYPNGM